MKSPLEKILDLGLVLGAFFLLGYSLLRFIYALRKTGANVKIGKGGAVEVDILPSEQSKFSSSDISQFHAWAENRFDAIEKQLQTAKAPEKKFIYLNQHELFLALKKAIEHGIDLFIDPSIYDSGVAKEVIETKLYITKKFLEECLIPSFFENCKNFIKELQQQDTDEKKLIYLSTITEKIFLWENDYNQKARHLKIHLPIEKILIGIPPIYLKKFNTWHKPHINIILNKIQSILTSNFYETWDLKIISILDSLDMIYRLMLEDARQTILFINGELDRELDRLLKSLP